jgi:hypothetical protein
MQHKTIEALLLLLPLFLILALIIVVVPLISPLLLLSLGARGSVLG